jgi:signal transduction histidine kinase
MATIHLHQRTTATPGQFVAGLTDFGPGRSELFANSADGYLKVHSRGPAEADVTEGSHGVMSEALANAAKHAQASRIDISVAPRDGRLLLSIRDDGVGGADRSRGSGIIGLTDRVEALGGSISVESPPGEGTRITAELPRELEVRQER